MKKVHLSKAQRKGIKKMQRAARAHERRLGPSKAQVAAARRNLQIARHDVHLRRLGKKAPRKKPKLSPYEVNCCAAEAVAASLRLWGGNPSAEDMLQLYWRAAKDPEEGASLEDVLMAATRHGIAGWHPQFRLAADWSPGSIFVYDLWDGLDAHAVTLHPSGGLISWGETCPVITAPDEVWELAWHR